MAPRGKKHKPVRAPKLKVDDMRIVEVAHMLGLKYLRARDLMLSGKCGDSRYEGRTLLVKRAEVERLRDLFKQHRTA